MGEVVQVGSLKRGVPSTCVEWAGGVSQGRETNGDRWTDRCEGGVGSRWADFLPGLSTFHLFIVIFPQIRQRKWRGWGVGVGLGGDRP